jgi:hypothetical protein
VRRLAEDLRARAEAWLEDGISPSTIAKKIGCSTRTVQRIQSRLYAPDEAAASFEDYGDEDLAEEIGPSDDYEHSTKRSRRAKRARAAGDYRGWIAALAAVACGISGVVWVLRRSSSFPIGALVSTTALPPFIETPGSAPARRIDKTPPRALRPYATVAPHPGDDAIFGPDAMVDEDRNPRTVLNAYQGFATFPNAYDFFPESGT